MARRSKQGDLAHDLHHLFLHVPAWLCLPAAAVAYAGVQVGIGLLAAANPAYHAFIQSATLLGCMAAGVVLVAGLSAAVKKFERRSLYERQRSLESVRALGWAEFEQLVGEAYRRQGYRVAETGGGGADGGIDLILHKEGERLLVQCKQWRVSKVGVKPVRELYGVLMAHGAGGAVFVTSGTYTREAMDFAAGKPLQLVDGELLCRLILPVGQQQSPPQSISAARVMMEEPTLPVEVPDCPACERPMVRRTASRGTNAGAQFWGCSAYPRCRGTRQVVC